MPQRINFILHAIRKYNVYTARSSHVSSDHFAFQFLFFFKKIFWFFLSLCRRQIYSYRIHKKICCNDSFFAINVIRRTVISSMICYFSESIKFRHFIFIYLSSSILFMILSIFNFLHILF